MTTPNTSVHPTVAVIGGTGHTGRRVADRLRARGLDIEDLADVADRLLTAADPSAEMSA